MGIFFAEIPLEDKINQVWVDDISTRGSGIIMAGAFQDTHFGTIEASNYTEVGLAQISYNESATFDSAVLELRVSSVYGPQIENTLHNLEVYQLADTINLFKDGEIQRFTSSSTEPLRNQIGTFEFEIFTDSIGLQFSDTGIKLNDTINDSEDSVYFENNFDANGFYIYRHKATLEQNYGASIFNALKNVQTDSSATGEIANIFKGIHLKASGSNGAILSYINDIYSGLSIYYTEDGEQKKIKYPLSTTASYNNISPNNKVGWSGSDFDELTNLYSPFQTNNDLAYLQAGTNLLLNIDLSAIRGSFLDTIPNAVVQNAELVISDYNTDLDQPASLRFWLTSADSLANENYAVVNFPNLTSGGITFGNPSVAINNTGKDEYRLALPLTFEVLISDFEFDQVIIAPVNSQSLVLPQNSVRRLVFNKNDLKLRMYYTIPETQ
ncbi:MAG: DUF4270 family protein [Fulvivirga sp.]